MERTSAQSKPKRRYHLEFSLGAAILSAMGMVFLLAWIFTLGVLAGRGLLSGGMESFVEVKKQLSTLQDTIAKRSGTKSLEQMNENRQEPDLKFHQHLVVKEEPPVIVEPPPLPLTAPPEPTPLKPAALEPLQESPAVPSTPDETGYIVQVASLDTANAADTLVEKLRKRGYEAYSYQVLVRGKPFFRVRCGVYKSHQEALTMRERLANQEGLNGFVLKLENQ